jgi:isoleucyl-tRNA synthetase
MRLVIDAPALGRSARGAADVKLRQPLARARVFVGSARAARRSGRTGRRVAEEINVKAIEIVSEVGELVSYKLLPNSRVLGPKFGKDFPRIRKALEALDPAQAARQLQAGQGLVVDLGDGTAVLTADDVLVQTEARGGLAVASDKGVTVAVDTTLTPELVQEGYARDVVRHVNNMRKDAGLEISDRIELAYQADGEVAAALVAFAGYVQQETLAVALTAVPLPTPPDYQQTITVGEQDIVLSLRKSA